MVKRGSQNKFGGRIPTPIDDNAFQFRRLGSEKNRTIELTAPEQKKFEILPALKSVIPFTKESKKAKDKYKDYDLLDTSPFIGFGPNLNPTGLVGGGKALLSVIPKTPASVAGTILVGGALFESPTLRDVILDTPGKLVDVGRDIGDKVEEIASGETSDNTPAWLKKLLGYGLTAGIVAGATGLLIDKFKDKTPSIPKIKDLPLSGIPQYTGGTPQFLTPAGSTSPTNSFSSPSGGGDSVILEPAKEEKKAEVKTKPITINNNIQIKNTNRKTEKFINTVYA